MRNNKEQFENIHQEYYPMVQQMCLGFMKGDLDIAKDLSQEVFINTWKALKNFKSESSYKTWIYRITVNTCLKYIRDNKEKYQVSIDKEHIQVANETNPQTDANYQSLYSAIGQLGEVDRLIMMLILDELEYEEIAKIIGVSEGNLRVKIHRIKKNLKKILENE